jgi:hydrogenase expression/formation protein HypE
MTRPEFDKILLAHGGGGQLSDELLRTLILPRVSQEESHALTDAAALMLGDESVYLTTDSYVVKPLFFNGGDIGKLAVCGTINDLAVAGARPVALSLSLILEEGLDVGVLERILESAGQTARESGVTIVCGDTKTVETGSADKIFINTAGVGVKHPRANLGFNRIAVGDKVLINGTIGDHGMTIISQREDIRFQSELKSDCAPLADLIMSLLDQVDSIKFMRDPTRGGLAATLNEVVMAAKVSMDIHERCVPVDTGVRAAADVLGFDVLNIANEGKFITVVAAQDARRCIDICRAHPLGRSAEIIGEVVRTQDSPVVELITHIGGRRIVQMPYGREMPRIC